MTPDSSLSEGHSTPREIAAALALLVPCALLGAIILVPFSHRRGALGVVALVGGACAAMLALHGVWHPGWEIMSLLSRAGITGKGPGSGGPLAAVAIEAAGFGALMLLLFEAPTRPGKRAKRAVLFRSVAMRHPWGRVRLGLDESRAEPFDVDINRLPRGVGVWAVPGAGKTVAVARFVEGVIASGGAALVLDGKPPGLGMRLREIAKEHGVGFSAIDPMDPHTLVLDPMQGSAADISNKLLGGLVGVATGNSLFYRQLIQGALPAIIEGLQSQQELNPLRLTSVLSDSDELQLLARKANDKELTELANAASRDRMMAAAMAGMGGRLRALWSGYYKPVLIGAGHRFDWRTTEERGVTLIALPYLAAGTDTTTVLRVVLADLHQEVARRLAAKNRGEKHPFLLVVLDEVSVLAAADAEIEGQLVGLYLQAREAGVGMIVAGQALPESPLARRAVLAAGMTIGLELTADDAEAIAREIGTQETVVETWQLLDGARTGTGSARHTHEFRCHPQVFRTLRTGEAIVFTRPSEFVQVKVAATNATIIPFWKMPLGWVAAAFRLARGDLHKGRRPRGPAV
jgi:hypothetical protein